MDFINKLFEDTIAIVTGMVNGVLDLLSAFVLGVFNLNVTDSSSGILATIDEYFPMFAAMRWVMVFIGLTIAILMLIMNLYRTLLHSLASEEVEHPFALIVRFIATVVLIFTSFTICKYVIFLASYWYSAMWNTTNSVEIESSSFTEMSEVMKGTLLTDIALNATLVGPVVILFLSIAIGSNILKLLMESVERYILIAILSYTSPIAFAAFGSRTTSRVMAGWMRVYFSQFLLLTLNIWIIRTFNQAMARFIAMGSLASTVSTKVDPGQTNIRIGGVTASLAVPQVFSQSGSSIMFMMVLLALLIAAQRLDAYLAATGLNVAQTGSKLLGEMMGAAKAVQMVVNGTQRAMSGGASRGADMMRGSLVPVHSGQTAAAVSASGIGAGMAPNGNIQMVGGERVVTKAAADKTTGAVLGRIEDPTRASTATEVTSVPADLADRQSAGHYTIGANGEPMKTMAQGPLAWEALSAIQTKPNAGIPDMKDGAMAGLYNHHYNQGLAQGEANPAEYARKKQDAFAAEHGGLSELQKHRNEVGEIMPEGTAMINGQPVHGLEIMPQEGMPGVYKVSGTAEDGTPIKGSLVDENVVGERSKDEYPDATHLSDKNGLNQYAFLSEDPGSVLPTDRAASLSALDIGKENAAPRSASAADHGDALEENPAAQGGRYAPSEGVGEYSDANAYPNAQGEYAESVSHNSEGATSGEGDTTGYYDAASSEYGSADASFYEGEAGAQSGDETAGSDIPSSGGYSESPSAGSEYAESGEDAYSDNQMPLRAAAFEGQFVGPIESDSGAMESVAQYGSVAASAYNGQGIYTALTAPDAGNNMVHVTMEDANRYHRREGDATYRGSTRAVINGQERTFNVYAQRVPKDQVKSVKVRPGKRKSFTSPSVRQTPRSGPQYKRSSPGFLDTLFSGRKKR